MNSEYTIRAEGGFSIVELMIALMLGLILLGGVLQVFLSSRQTYSANEAMSRMQENGRFALEFIARSARLAGYLEPRLVTDKPFPVIPTDASGRCTRPDLCSRDGGGSNPDRVSFMLQPPLIDGDRRDCLGNPIAPAAARDATLIINSFAIIPANGNNPAALACRSDWYNTANKSWTPGPQQTLVEGVDSLQVLYGVDNGGDYRSPNQYVSADRVSNWDKVRSVRIAVLANSIERLTPAPAARRFVLLDASPLDAAAFGNDDRARQIFTTTIQLKNFE